MAFFIGLYTFLQLYIQTLFSKATHRIHWTVKEIHGTKKCLSFKNSALKVIDFFLTKQQSK